MKKEIVKRAALGALIGVFISVAISIYVSALYGGGEYFAYATGLAEDFGSELNAVIVQTALSMVLGAMWGGVSVCWDIESWSLLRATVTHFLISAPVSVLIAYVLRWMHERSVVGIIVYLGVFAIIYAIIWLISYSIIKYRLKAANAKLGK